MGRHAVTAAKRELENAIALPLRTAGSYAMETLGLFGTRKPKAVKSRSVQSTVDIPTLTLGVGAARHVESVPKLGHEHAPTRRRPTVATIAPALVPQARYNPVITIHVLSTVDTLTGERG